ncbi:hypothetical protein TWF481_002792 [Arthrobotrys musiformis]|uniref:Uncharacterized protein n=1 Tax=Arthrobotrys musiformis TaxID=47236 RepID=A0AAV9VXD6_9PEZI
MRGFSRSFVLTAFQPFASPVTKYIPHVHSQSAMATTEAQPKPPKISRPRIKGGHLSTRLLEAAFSVEYYQAKTGSWQVLKMGAALDLLRTILEPILVSFKSELDPDVRFFRNQSEPLLNKIYSCLVNEIEKRIQENADGKLPPLLADMLSSTEGDDRWIFNWLAPTTLKNLSRRGNSTAGIAGPSESSFRGATASIAGPREGFVGGNIEGITGSGESAFGQGSSSVAGPGEGFSGGSGVAGIVSLSESASVRSASEKRKAGLKIEDLVIQDPN